MEQLLEGIVKFRKEDFERHKELFQGLKDSQKPHTLFITCSDSRIVPHLITDTMPGELFVLRNVANMVPPYQQTEEYLSTTSVIEYAVNALDVDNIVVCGHSNCGGCAALHLSDSELEKVPHTKQWVTLGDETRKKVLEVVDEDEETTKARMTEQINVVEQMERLKNYPSIKEKLEDDKIKIAGWHYVIETGEVYIYNQEKGHFELAN